MNKIKRFIVFLVALNVLVQCTNQKEEVLYPDTSCKKSLPESVSFANDILPILSTNCATPTCHAGANPKGNFNLESANAYAQLLEMGSGYVDTLNPKTSVVYSALVSQSNPMPPTQRLDQCAIDLIEKWMQQGAKDN